MSLTNIYYSVIIHYANATMAQLVEHILGKDEVAGSIPASSSKIPHESVGFFIACSFISNSMANFR